MVNWNQLSTPQKLLIGIAVMFIAATTPELMFLIDVGGIELAVAALMVYLKPLIVVLSSSVEKFKRRLLISYLALKSSAVAKPSVFATHATFCCVSMFLTGSLAFSICFLMPGMLLNSSLV